MNTIRATRDDVPGAPPPRLRQAGMDKPMPAGGTRPRARPPAARRVGIMARAGLPLGLMAALALLCSAPARAQQPLGEGTVMETVARLKPGEFLWAPGIAPEGPVMLIVNVATQRMVLYRNGVPVAVSTVSTGRKGYRTPTGVFTVLEKQVEHYSSIYDNAPMPYMQRLTWRGVALHAGRLPGYPASHGCIRLPHEFARLLYGVTRLGMTVIVTDGPAVPRLAPEADLLGESPGIDRTGAEQWHPERSPSGPVSIVVSAADARVVVLRNGREIGSAPVTIAGPVTGTRAYILRAVDANGFEWLSVPLAGEAASAVPSAELAQRISVSTAFRRAIAGVVAPGTTVVVTADSLRSRPASASPLIEAEPR